MQGEVNNPMPSHQSPVTSHQSPVPNHRSPITNHQSPVTYSLNICCKKVRIGSTNVKQCKGS
ncbi:hypothetical protein H6F47_12765 [Sphaerospermopsis sp. FACHB-1094]|uniref:hypothetical protein n=1 Tax=Sphaerospermopsis TaxID=752201 RepID=UPI0013969E3C|nr:MULTISPECIES: hypothetical protein [Sphaerospermopsis]MBD2133277.1 hypothetical protein [Sphaerospermopsis sp. FACHB-1094]